MTTTHYFILALDDDGFVRVHRATENFPGDGLVHYTRETSAKSLVRALSPDAKFYGMLDALLVTEEKILAAEPITPVPLDTAPNVPKGGA